MMILQQAYHLFSSLPTLVDVGLSSERKFNVCGDTHGQFYDLVNIFATNGGCQYYHFCWNKKERMIEVIAHSFYLVLFCFAL
jgi:hypothetical protein